jgi:hypothetical protein
LSFFCFDIVQSQVKPIYLDGYVPLSPSIGWDSLRALIKYPNLSIRAGLEMTGIIEITVDSAGRIESLVIKDSPPIFSTVIDSAIHSTRWIPACLNSKPIKSKLSIPIYFRLNNNEQAKPIIINGWQKLENLERIDTINVIID